MSKGLLPFLAALVAIGAGCTRIAEAPAPADRLTVDFLEPAGLAVNALAPQVVRADPARNRVFAACANSSAAAVIDCATGRVKNIPIGARMPRRLREAGTAVSASTGRFYACGAEVLIEVDADRRSSRTFALPGDFEAVALDEERGRAYLVGRTSPDMAVVDTEDGSVRLVPYAEPAAPLPFMAASAPPPIRFPFVDKKRGRIHIVDGTAARLVTIDPETEKVAVQRNLSVEAYPRWHVAGFDPESGRVFAALENERRQAVHALAIDTAGGRDQVLAIPEGHTEPAGVACDPGRGELYIPYDNNKLIHVVVFGETPEIAPVELPSMGVDAAAYDPASRTIFAAGWMQAALYIVDLKERKCTFTVPFFPVYPHMNSMAFNSADGRLYVPTGSTAVNGTFGAAVSVFDPATLAFSEIRTGWAPVSLAPAPDGTAFFVLDAEREMAVVRPDGTLERRELPYRYPRQALGLPGGKHTAVAYGPHSSMWPTFYIGGTRNGVLILDAGGGVVRDHMTPRLAQGMILDKKGRLWALQNTWGREAPFLLCLPGGGLEWFELRLPPEADNECVLRLLALDEESGLLYVGRAGNLNTENGLVHVVDPETRSVTATVEAGRTPAGICVLPGKAYVSNFDDGTVTVIQDGGADVTAEPAGLGPFAMDAHRETGAVYVVNHLEETLTVLGPAARTIALPAGALPNNILVEQLSGHVFVTAHAPNESRVYRYDPDLDKLETIHVCRYPYGAVTFDQANAAFMNRGQWGDGIFRITDMALDRGGRLWITDYLGGKLFILRVF